MQGGIYHFLHLDDNKKKINQISKIKKRKTENPSMEKISEKLFDGTEERKKKRR